MTREHIQYGLRWLGVRLKQKAFAIEHYRNTGRLRGAKGFDRAHNRALQPFLFSGADCGARFASAATSALVFNGLARAVGVLPSGEAAKPLAGSAFGVDGGSIPSCN